MDCDTSYVNLSLNKYNELYEKAKRFDEFSEKVEALIKTIEKDKQEIEILEEEND